MIQAMNGLNSMYQTVRYDKALKYGLYMLLIAFLQGLFNFLMIWLFTRIGMGLARLYRKLILKKYLQIHVSFYDITKNSPSALLTRLLIDAMQLNNLFMTTVGTTVQCGFIFILELILGCIYEYRLILDMFCFVPFIV